MSKARGLRSCFGQEILIGRRHSDRAANQDQLKLLGELFYATVVQVENLVVFVNTLGHVGGRVKYKCRGEPSRGLRVFKCQLPQSLFATASGIVQHQFLLDLVRLSRGLGSFHQIYLRNEFELGATANWAVGLDRGGITRYLRLRRERSVVRPLVSIINVRCGP